MIFFRTNKINKRGADKIISVYWFAILFIVAVAIVYMVYAFYGNPYDVRDFEADILTGKVAGCFSQAGFLREDWNEINNENILEKCDLNFDVEDTNGWQDNQFYLEVKILDFNSKNHVSSFEEGNAGLKDFCEIEGKHLPICLERSLYVLDREKKQYQIDILTIVRKTEKNAK